MHDKVPSKTEARKLIKSNGFSINKSKVVNEADKMTDFKLINDKYLLLQKGKKDYTVVVVR
jgi:tyrosyl-tRNA synthetase